MLIRLSSVLVVLGLVAAATSSALAQDIPGCECPDRDSEALHAPDTLFQVAEGFDVAYCGQIDRSVQPFVYTDLTMWTCGLVHDSLEARGAPQGCHLYVSRSMFIVDGLALLPTGADMHLERRPCWRTEHRLFVAEDSSAFAIAGPITELIATFQEPTREQFARVQRRLDGMKPTMYWTDAPLLGEIFLCAIFDTSMATRFREIWETYIWSGANAVLYDEFLKILHDRRQ